MKILHIVGDCNPARGGVIEGVRRLGENYRDQGHEQHLLTMDAPDDPWVAEFPSTVFAMGRKGAAKRFYPAQAIGWLREHARDYDGVIVDGLWNAATLAAARVLPHGPVPYAVFPHGMLDPWFRELQPVKEWIKRQQFRIVEGPLLRGARAVLFTTGQERKLAAQSWPGWKGVEEKVVGFGTNEPPPFEPAMARAFRDAVRGLGEAPYLLFLSRIHPKKGCEIMLEGFAQVLGGQDTKLVVAGPGDPDYVETLQAQAETLGIGSQVLWPGLLSGEAKWGGLYGCEAMMLTSYQENFGVVVVETMACRRPVLISDQVNIHDAVSEGDAGIVCQTSAGSVAQSLDRLWAMGDGERQAMGARGRSMFEERFSMDRVAGRILSLFERKSG